MNSMGKRSAKAVQTTRTPRNEPFATKTAILPRWIAVVAAALAMLFVSASPARAALACRKWDIYSTTMFVRQSNGFTVGVTFGRAVREDSFVQLGPLGHVYVEGKKDSGIPQNARFSRANGFLQFEVLWRAGGNDSSRGLYSANPANIRSIESGELRGGLIADLSGRTNGYTNQDLGFRLVQSQKATAAARLTADRKFLASLS